MVWKKTCVGNYCINMDVTSYILRYKFLRNVQNKTLTAAEQMVLKVLVGSETGVTEFLCVDMKWLRIAVLE